METLANDGRGTGKLPKKGTPVVIVGGVLDGQRAKMGRTHKYTSLGWGERYYTEAMVEFTGADGTVDTFEFPISRLRLA